MSAFLAICMACVFSAWIWILKQELSCMQENLFTPSGAEPAKPETHQPTRSAATLRHQAVAASTPRKIRRSDGVPVWTIEC